MRSAPSSEVEAHCAFLEIIVVDQDGQRLFVATVSFHTPEPGLEYEIPDQDVPPPDDLPTGRYDGPWFESRDVPG